MPDALLFAKNDDYNEEIQKFALENNLRLKFSFEFNLIEEWLSTKPFDLLILPAEITFEQQQRLAYALWDLNPKAYVVLFDPEDHSGLNKKKVRLMGATLAIGENYLEQIEKLARRIEGSKLMKKNEFNVIVVEDLDAARDIICSFVESVGFPKVQGVSSAEDALEILKKKDSKVDCIITDERMPGMKGHELISELRNSKDYQDMPLIVLTAHGTQDCLLQSLQVGASGFLVKPPSKRDLMREMARAIRVSTGLEKARLVNPEQAQELLELI